MRKQLSAAISGVLFLTTVLGGLLQPARGADFDRMTAVLSTHDTQLDLNGDGKIDLTRRFDREGRVVEYAQKFRDGSVEHYRLSPDYRQQTTRYNRANGSWTNITRLFDARYRWTYAETLFGRRAAQAHGRIVQAPDGERVRQEYYERKRGRWELKTTSFLPLVQLAGEARPEPPAEPPRTALLPTPLWTVGSVKPCPRFFLSGAKDNCMSGAVFPILRLGTSDLAAAPSLVPLECGTSDDRDNPALGMRTLTLSTGVEIDLATCGETPDALVKTKKMISTSFEYLKCLADVNPDIGQKLLNYLTSQHPRIRCAGHLRGQPDAEKKIASACAYGLSASAEQYCAKTVLPPKPVDAKPVSAFRVEGTPELVFVDADPVSTGANTANSAEIFVHELMHAAGVPCGNRFHNGGDPTNNPLWRYADPVYGFNMLCGGVPPGSKMLSRDPLVLMEHGFLLERGKMIKNPDGSMFTPPGSPYEIGCTALRRLSASHSCYTFIQPASKACPDASSAPDATSIDPYCKAKADQLIAVVSPPTLKPGEMDELDKQHDAECSPTSSDFKGVKGQCFNVYCPKHPSWSSCKAICATKEYAGASFCGTK